MMERKDRAGGGDTASAQLEKGAAVSAPIPRITPTSEADLLLELLQRLKADAYRFVTPTPSTHGTFLKRAENRLARDVRDVLGWSMPFTPDALPRELFNLLDRAGALHDCDGALRARVRVSSLEDDLFVHSAFPPADPNAVFFGPDTYRFARFLEHELAGTGPVRRLVDIGVGAGPGVVAAARACRPREIVATDINPRALQLARINLAAAGLDADMRHGSGLDALEGRSDLIIANPPFIAGTGGRVYRDGGGMHGAQLSLAWAVEGAKRLSVGGRMLLYTGSAIVAGQDRLKQALIDQLQPPEFTLAYRELDPDIFGEMLAADEYEDVERIAAVGAVITRRVA